MTKMMLGIDWKVAGAGSLRTGHASTGRSMLSGDFHDDRCSPWIDLASLARTKCHAHFAAMTELDVLKAIAMVNKSFTKDKDDAAIPLLLSDVKSWRLVHTAEPIRDESFSQAGYWPNSDHHCSTSSRASTSANLSVFSVSWKRTGLSRHPRQRWKLHPECCCSVRSWPCCL
jgi:hypothetical protein